MTLADLKNGEKGIIIKVRGRGAFRKRIIEMGFIKGKIVTVIKNAPLKDPIEYKILDYNVSIRRSEADLIDIQPINKNTSIPLELLQDNHAYINKGQKQHRYRHGWENNDSIDIIDKPVFQFKNNIFDIDKDIIKNKTIITALEKEKTIHVALVGNPNSGKTTLFNIASGLRERVGNYSGVTVKAKKAKFKQQGYTFNIVDLPGTYSITEYSPEELYVREYIYKHTPDVVINVIDASNLERNLYLTTQLIDMDIKVIAALNMHDELDKKGDMFDHASLGKMIGIPFIPTVASKGKGIDELFSKVIEAYEDREKSVRHIHINYGNDIEKAIDAIQKKINIEENYHLTVSISSRFLAIKLLEKDKPIEELIHNNCTNYLDILTEAKRAINQLESNIKDDTEILITDARYGFIAGALKETYKSGIHPNMTPSERIDTILTNNIFGFPIFLLFMWITFQLTFSLGKYPMDLINLFTNHVSEFITFKMQNGLLKELLVDGVIAGVGGVIAFLPNIMILFFMISLMEDTGYMARASFIMDKLMHKIGLHGKSFIPLIMGFGCNVPAIMATRTLESRKDRVLTMLIIPFMSCSARLPVYVLFISAFFPDSPGSILFMLYGLGILIGIISAISLRKIFFKKSDIPFVMELPPYRLPYIKNTAKHMWEKGVQYLKKIGGVILIASIIIWALGRFPYEIKYSKDYENQISQIEKHYKQKIDDSVNNPIIIDSLKKERDNNIQIIETEKKHERLEKSFIGRIGHFIEPVISPLGFDWKMGVSVITGLAAKEIVVGTMGILYHSDKKGDTLIKNLQNQTYKSGNKAGQKVFTPLSAFGFMVFVLLYFPCVASIATIKKESESWKWAFFVVLYTTGIAWLITFLIYQIGSIIL